jgi:NADH-quinone oxidoreductase subunit H
MLFGYEVPLFLTVLTPAILANSWRWLKLPPFTAAATAGSPEHPGFPLALICVQAKLERTPFDIPHAETEIVGGTFTEYSGKKLALFRLMMDVELVVASGLLATVFLGGFPGGFVPALINFIIKTLLVISLLSLLRAMTSRIRVDQVIALSWRYLAPLAVLQLVIIILVKGLIS